MSEKRKRGNLLTRGAIDVADKEFECESCGKKYVRYPSLYTPIKLKHDRNAGLKTVVPDLKPKLNRNRDIATDVPIVDINSDTLNLFCQVQFLDLFKEIKELAETNDNVGSSQEVKRKMQHRLMKSSQKEDQQKISRIYGQAGKHIEMFGLQKWIYKN